MSIRLVIVDDEPLARRGVVVRLAEYPDVEIVGQAANGPEALELITRLRPALVFLDIQMPGMSGIDVLRALPPRYAPVVILLTAYDEYAVAAFQVQALDYLLKPVDDERFRSAMERANRLVAFEQQGEMQTRLHALLEMHAEDSKRGSLKRFAVRTGTQIKFVQTSEIDWIEGAGDYAALHVGKKEHLVRQALHTLEEKLHTDEFVRIHRSAIVRVDRITGIQPLTNRDCELTLAGGTILRASRTYRKRLLQAVGELDRCK